VVAERVADDGDGPPLPRRELRPPPRRGVGVHGEQAALRPAVTELAQDPRRRRAQVVGERAQQAVAIPALAQLGDPGLREQSEEEAPHVPGARTGKPCAAAASARRSSYV